MSDEQKPDPLTTLTFRESEIVAQRLLQRVQWRAKGWRDLSAELRRAAEVRPCLRGRFKMIDAADALDERAAELERDLDSMREEIRKRRQGDGS